MTSNTTNDIPTEMAAASTTDTTAGTTTDTTTNATLLLKTAFRYILIYILSMLGICMTFVTLQFIVQILLFLPWNLLSFFWPNSEEGMLMAINIFAGAILLIAVSVGLMPNDY